MVAARLLKARKMGDADWESNVANFIRCVVLSGFYVTDNFFLYCVFVYI